MKSLLIIELWGIGDATLMSSALQGFLAGGWEITVLAKPQTCALLKPVYPQIETIEFDAPWTAFYNKYQVLRWPWGRIFEVLKRLRQGRFEAAVSVRSDPRDHMLMWLGGVRRRIGFFTRWSRVLLNEPIFVRDPNSHRVEDWWTLQDRLIGSATPHFPPRLVADAALVEQFRVRFRQDPRPILALHCGARIAVRRWPESYYRQLIGSLQKKFDFQLILIPDPDGYGGSLRDLAEHMFAQLTLPELLAVLNCAAQVVCNDSGPCHVAAALGIPVIVFFGPTRPESFRPFGEHHLVVIRDICPLRPCYDYCQFSEPYCLTKLTPDLVYKEVENQLVSVGRFPVQTTA